MSETCPASQGRGERHIVCTDESEGLTRYPGAVNPSDPAYAGPPPFTQGRLRVWRELGNFDQPIGSPVQGELSSKGD